MWLSPFDVGSPVVVVEISLRSPSPLSTPLFPMRPVRPVGKVSFFFFVFAGQVNNSLTPAFECVEKGLLA